jgi:5-hydroxyisourate hydrolase-like protein (transthyretin family)
MKRAGLLTLVLCAAPVFAAISGTVINRTTGAPQAGVEVEFIKVDQGGMQVAGQAKSDAKGAFTIDQAPGQTSMIRATLDGVTYTHVLQPAQPTTGLSVDVYNASTQQGAAKVSKHMLLFGPSAGQMTVQETFLISNSGKTTWDVPNGGTVRFYLPGAANGKGQASTMSVWNH